jgi:hypothetical protein
MEEYTNVIFPEGTLLEHKNSVQINIKRSKARNIPTPEKVMTPKTKGFVILLNHLKVDGIINCTLKYNERFSIFNFIIGRRIQVDVFMGFEELPQVDTEEAWLIKKFQEKDTFLKGLCRPPENYYTININHPKRIKLISTLGMPWLFGKTKNRIATSKLLNPPTLSANRDNNKKHDKH